MADDQDAGASNEQSGLNDAGNLVKFYLEGGRIFDLGHVQIEDDVARFGLKHDAVSLAQDRSAS